MGSDVDSLLGLIYEGVFDQEAWNAALLKIRDRVRAHGVGLGMQDMASHQFRDLGAVGIDRALHDVYQRLAPGNRIWSEIARKHQPLTDRMVMPKAEFVRSELFADWFAPQDFGSVMAAPAMFDRGASAVIVAFGHVGRDDFVKDDLAELAQFATHFGRALALRLNNETYEKQLLLAYSVLNEEPDAFYVVDRQACLHFANQAAKGLLARGAVVSLRGNKFEFVDLRANAALLRLVTTPCSGEFTLLSGERRSMIVEVRVSTTGHGRHGSDYITIKLRELERSPTPLTPAHLQGRLGLTARQAEIVAELAAGRTEAQAAFRLGVGEPTVHTHIRRLYDRLRVRSRAELMVLLTRHGFPTSGG